MATQRATASRGDAGYTARRAWLSEYFDRTAVDAWAALTSDAPVGYVRRTVRDGRDRMRATLLGYLPADLTGARVLDAGCGTGAAATALAARGADVVAVDLSPTLVALARERTPPALAARITYRAGDMLDASLGTFDHVLAMDSLIHYDAPDAVAALSALTARTRRAIVFTVAPRTGMLAVKRAVGRLLPRAARAPAIEPVALPALHRALDAALGQGWRRGRSARVSTGFYTSQAMELVAEQVAGNDGRGAQDPTTRSVR